MQNIIIDQPYHFVPPRHGTFWPMLFRHYLPTYLRKFHGIESYELIGADRLKASLDAGHGILLAPNHCRPCDPMVFGLLGGVVSRPVYLMASWRLFMQFNPKPTPEQMLETIERFEEDLTDTVRVHRPIHAIIEVGEPLEVGPMRERGVETDPIMAKLREQLETMLARLKERNRPNR